MISGTRRIVLVLLRLVLGGVFVYAGALKAGNANAFAGTIAAYRIMPYFANVLVASILPWWEILLGLLLIVGYRVRVAAASLFLLNAAFTIALASAMIRGLDIDCGCFGKTARKTPLYISLVRDLAFLGFAMAIYRLQTTDSARTSCGS